VFNDQSWISTGRRPGSLLSQDYPASGRKY
jgi:hypothetical protein